MVEIQNKEELVKIIDPLFTKNIKKEISLSFQSQYVKKIFIIK